VKTPSWLFLLCSEAMFEASRLNLKKGKKRKENQKEGWEAGKGVYTNYLSTLSPSFNMNVAKQRT
jgi:hypothetical protein